MKQNKDFTLPRLIKGKLKWYVYYKVYDPKKDCMKTQRDYAGLNIKGQTDKERKSVADSRIIALTTFLKNVGSPLENRKEPNKTIAEIMEDFIKLKEKSLRKKSLTHYTQGKRVFTEYGYTYLKPENFTPLLAQGFSDWLLTKKNYAGKSHNNHISYVSSMFNMMVDREMIDKNPFKKVKFQPVDVGRNMAFSDKQRKEIRDYLERNNHPLFMLVQFIYYCFIRPNELMQIQVKHIDFDTNSINIPSHISKNRKQASVEMPKAFAQLVRNRYKNIDPEWYVAGKGLIPNHTPVHRNRITAAHKKVLEDLNISDQHTLYSHKHTGAVQAIKAGVNPYDLMRQLRHSSLEQTMIYLKTLGLVPNTGYSTKQTTF